VFGSGEADFGAVQPRFDASIHVGFGGAKLTSDAGFLLLREVDERFDVLASAASELEDTRSPSHTRHSLLEMIRQRVYQIAAGYEDCNDADHLRIDPALRLATGKKEKHGAGQSALSRLENTILGSGAGILALERAIARSADAALGDRVTPLY